ncbi:hypothetical protein J2X48_002887 [Bosea sp. BE271]|uniref:DUF3606 domain-containing protein n=1 Tax=Bosea TaxID=85413 RepID=UPI00285DA791|nr:MULTISPECIES: DUF3606 domain-containing protein [Bosea]MDR6828971.1 hypothetical protein [Bosea robiniae]MDR6895855.1 hypothetical protein [Bosea sp. BE109]MDR7139251.1 hypothetical protein [Bosea sp. BE168]MDR7175951.1 hypothetical protein [Bosea sp. BE271]
MADDKTNRGPQDRSRINLSEDYEVRYWTDRFGVSKAQLEAAVREVGASSDAVETELRRSTLAGGSKQ